MLTPKDLTLALAGRWYGAKGTARCPAHDDQIPSLEIKAGSKQDTIFICRAGCPQSAVVAALQTRGLWPNGKDDVPWHPPSGKIVATYDYSASDGTPLRKHRIEPGNDGKSKSFRWEHQNDNGWSAGYGGHTPLLYRHDNVDAAGIDDFVFVVESEKSADLLTRYGLFATSPGGSNGWKPEYTTVVSGMNVVVLPDNCTSGQQMANIIKDAVPQTVVVELTALPMNQGPDHWGWWQKPGAKERLLGIVRDRRTIVEKPPAQANISTNLPEAFWSARSLFRQIRTYAHYNYISADALLLMCLLRTGAFIPHDVKVYSQHKPCRLNLLGAITGASGTGKTSIFKIGRDVVLAPDENIPDGAPIGSGEGLAELFMGEVEVNSGKTDKSGSPKLEKQRKQIRHNAFVYGDEGSVLRSYGQRKGSTLDDELRKVFSEITIGQTNASKDTTRKVEDYCLSVCINMVAGAARYLFEMQEYGTPQRFLFASASDPSIPTNPEECSQPDISLRNAPLRVTFALEVSSEIQAEQIARVRGTRVCDPLDTHQTWIHCKVAAILCIWDERTCVTPEDWRLAGMIMENSRRVRDAVRMEGEEVSRTQDAQSAHRYAERNAVANFVAKQTGPTIERLAQQLADKVRRGMSKRRELTHATRHNHRHLFNAAMEYAEAHGLVEQVAEGKWEKRP